MFHSEIYTAFAFPPINHKNNATAPIDTPVSIKVWDTDPNPTAKLTAAIVRNPYNGTLSNIIQDTGLLTHTPNQGFIGDDSVKFKVNDGKVNSINIGIVDIAVSGRGYSFIDISTHLA